MPPKVVKKLNNKQQNELRTKYKKYTAVHIGNMKRRMIAGMTTAQAHQEVMKLKIKHLK